MRKLLAAGLTLLLIACSPQPPPPQSADEAPRKTESPPEAPPSEPETEPPPPEATPATPPALVGTAWVVERIEDSSNLKNRNSTLEFLEEGRASGNGGCNRYGSPVTIEGASVRFGEVLSTKMACEPAAMDQEKQFFTALAAVRGYRMEEGKLVLLDESGGPRLRLATNNDPTS